MSKKKKEKEFSTAQTIKRIVIDLKPIALRLIITGIVCMATVALSVWCPMILGDLTDMIYELGGGVALDIALFARLCLTLAIAYVASGALSSLTVVLMTTTTTRYYTRGLRVRLSDKLKRLPVSFFDNTSDGEFLSRINGDVSNMSTTIYVIIESFINGLLKIVAILILLFTINVYTAIAIMIFVPLSIILSALIAAKSEEAWKDYRKANGKLYGFVEEDYSGFETVKAFNLEERQKKLDFEISETYRKKLRKAKYLSGLVQPIIAFTDNLAYIVICLIGGYFAVSGTDGGLTVGQIVETILLAKLIAGPLESIAYGMGSLQHTFVCASRVYKILDMEEDKPADEPNLIPSGSGEVEFSHVYFSYSQKKPLIQDFNFKVCSGQKVALVGPTGGGKTTIVNLLMRFYDIDSGKITIDGVDTSKMDKSVLRNEFGMVLQDTWLFSGTIYDNIAYGKSGATREEVMAAAKQARIDEFIENLPDGYETVINEESTNVSSGQKQLITIARSYLANKKMLILDEATSNVDTRTELIIQKTMDELLIGRTSFVIAHRLSTIVNADIILVIDNGEIVEQGTHAELLKKNGFYTKIYNSQYEALS